MSKDVTATKAAEPLDAIIVGAGFGGMYALHKLRELGFRVRGFDRASSVGGTWYWNRYPGARCDVISLDYSYSFSNEIQQEWIWTEKYAAQPEILAYAEFVAKKLDLKRDIQFETVITSVVYDDARALWTLSTSKGERFEARFVIMASGVLSTPKDPEIPGLKDFKGETYFTSRWPHETVDFSGKRVGLIGNGSSGIQAFAEIAKEAGKLYLFQRTPSYTLPARNIPLDPAVLASVKETYPARRKEAKWHPAGWLRPLTDRKTLGISEAERRARFEDAWTRGGMAMFGEFGDILTDQGANDAIVELFREKLDQIIDDPAVAEKLKPHTFPFAGRRICLDTDYFVTFNRDNVELVDVSKDPILVTPNGVKAGSTTYDLDALVLAVGFDAMTGSLLAANIQGRNGLSLRDVWRDGPVSYLGIAVAGFPNLFTLTGPGSPSVLTNVIASIEQHVEWVADLMVHMRETGKTEVEATPEAADQWVRYNYDLVKGSLQLQANSWYLGANVPGKPIVFMPFAGGLGVYRDACDKIAADNYRGFKFDAGA